MQDMIKKEVFINASKETIYEAIANAEKVVRWFPDTLEGDYSVGGQPIMGFKGHGKNQVYIVAAKPYTYFAYRWVPGDTQFLGDVLSTTTTLVEFHIEEQSAGSCKVTLTESGFNQLPAGIMEDSFRQNSGGWDFMLDRLVKYIDAA